MIDTTTVIGFIAAAFTTFSFLPQTIKSWRTRETEDLSLFMLSFLAVGLFLWFLYGLLLKNGPIILSNGIGCSLVLSVLYLKIRSG
jgi:MtN3 and saliva related transmembrane protein